MLAREGSTGQEFQCRFRGTNSSRSSISAAGVTGPSTYASTSATDSASHSGPTALSSKRPERTSTQPCNENSDPSGRHQCGQESRPLRAIEVRTSPDPKNDAPLLPPFLPSPHFPGPKARERQGKGRRRTRRGRDREGTGPDHWSAKSIVVSQFSLFQCRRERFSARRAPEGRGQGTSSAGVRGAGVYCVPVALPVPARAPELTTGSGLLVGGHGHPCCRRDGGSGTALRSTRRCSPREGG